MAEKGFGVSSDTVETLEFRALINIPFAAAILAPLSAQRDMSSLRYAGMASVAALTYTLIVLVVECPFYFQQNESTSVIHAFKLDANILSGLSITFFAFTC